MLRLPVHHAALLVLALGTSATWSTSARASDPPAAAPPMTQATSFYQQGNMEFEKKNWPAAEEAYLKAWSIARTFDVAANLGEVEFHLGKMRETAEFLSYSLRTAPPSSKPAQRERTTHFLDQAKEKLGVVRLRGNVDGASITINGRSVAAEDVAHEIFVDPGTCTVIAKRIGYVETRTTTETKPGVSSDVTLNLEPAPVEKRSVLPWVLLGAGSVAGLGLGIAMTVASNGKASDADTKLAELHTAGGPRPCISKQQANDCATLANLNKESDTFHDLAIVGYATAGVLGAATLAYALWPAKKDPLRSDVSVAPLLGGDVAGLTVSGRF